MPPIARFWLRPSLWHPFMTLHTVKHPYGRWQRHKLCSDTVIVHWSDHRHTTASHRAAARILLNCQGPLYSSARLSYTAHAAIFLAITSAGVVLLVQRYCSYKVTDLCVVFHGTKIGENAPHVGGAEGRCHSLPDLPPVTVCWACQDAWTTQQLQDASMSMTLSLLKQAKQPCVQRENQCR